MFGITSEPQPRAVRRALLYAVFVYLFFAPVVGKLIGMEGETVRQIIETGGAMVMVCLTAYFASRAYERAATQPPGEAISDE